MVLIWALFGALFFLGPPTFAASARSAGLCPNRRIAEPDGAWPSIIQRSHRGRRCVPFGGGTMAP